MAEVALPLAIIEDDGGSLKIKCTAVVPSDNGGKCEMYWPLGIWEPDRHVWAVPNGQAIEDAIHHCRTRHMI